MAYTNHLFAGSLIVRDSDFGSIIFWPHEKYEASIFSDSAALSSVRP